MSSAAQGLLSSVFSFSSPGAKANAKRRLRQTRSLDPAIIRNCDNTGGPGIGGPDGLRVVPTTDYFPSDLATTSTSTSFSRRGAKNKTLTLLDEPISPSLSTPSIPSEVSPSSSAAHASFSFDYGGGESPHNPARGAAGNKRNTAGDLPGLARSAGSSLSGSTSALFSPRRWLQRKAPQADAQAHAVWRFEGDYTWSSLSGRCVRLTAVTIQSLSELERARLQEVAYARLHQDYDLGCQITMPKDGQKRKKSLRRKLDSLAKEKNKDKECQPQAFSVALSQVIGNDRTLRQRQDSYRQDPPSRDDHKDPSDLVSSILQVRNCRPSNKELSSSNSSLSSASETNNESTSPNTPEAAPRARRRGAMSVDSITDLDDSQSRLLEALQLSLPADAPSKKEKLRDKRLSLNPIYRQVPRVMDSCCQHLEKYGLQTVGIFRVGSSKKRVRQLREEFDRGVDVPLDEEYSVHDVAALLKEFLRDLPDPLLTKELYTSFINTMMLEQDEKQSVTQLLVYLLPACNSDTLHRLLEFLSTVADHAHDQPDKDGQEMTGNKMTPLNLATIFGPNLLHKQKNSDKEFSVQSSARAEESTAVISVLQRMICSYQQLFMVPPDLQNEVLMSLLETDPDVVDYLLRRKASQSPESPPSEASFSLSERRSSSDSTKPSSGEVSPYDNNSPVMSERRGPGATPPPPPCLPTDPCLLRLGGQPPLTPGPLRGPPRAPMMGNTNTWGGRGQSSSQEGLDGLHGDGRPPVRRTQTSQGVAEVRPHPPVSRTVSTPLGDRRRPQLSLDLSGTSRPLGGGGGQSGRGVAAAAAGAGSNEADRLAFGRAGSGRGGGGGGGRVVGGNAAHTSPPPRTLAETTNVVGAVATANNNNNLRAPPPYGGLRRTAPPPAEMGAEPGAGSGRSEWQDWQRDRWQIWQLLSSDNADTLPETLV
uniref:Rho GTPase activating protein 6 n=1 Tax=Gadus morhua TaxID=8049 RepID=A0A8C4ZMB1_GADMO